MPNVYGDVVVVVPVSVLGLVTVATGVSVVTGTIVLTGVVVATGTVSTLAGGVGQNFTDDSGTAAAFSSPVGLAVLPGVAVYVGDSGNNALRRVALPSAAVDTPPPPRTTRKNAWRRHLSLELHSPTAAARRAKVLDYIL